MVKRLFVVKPDPIRDGDRWAGRHLSFITGALQHARLYPNPAGQLPKDIHGLDLSEWFTDAGLYGKHFFQVFVSLMQMVNN